jgi:hypothetical protein
MRPFALSVLLLAACSSAAPGADDASEALEAPTSVPVIALDPPNTTIGVDGTLDAAERALPGALADEEAKSVTACGAHHAHPFVRFDDGAPHPTGSVPPSCGGDVECLAAFVDAKGCTATLFQEAFDRGTDKRAISVSCPRALCAGEPLDDLLIVPLDGSRGALAAVSGGDVARGTKVILDVNLTAMASFVEDAHTIALVPHLFVRFTDGDFAEIPGLPLLPHGAGAVFDDRSLDGYTAVLTIPATASKVEIYARFERWHYTREIVHDAADKIHVKDKTSDGFASNFGKNFVLTLQR